jgi:uroporphyrinogen-III synthase
MNGRRALQGLGIVITRPRAAAEPLAAALEGEGARAFVYPALEIEDVEDSPQLLGTLASLAQARLAIFVSANAVERGLARVRRAGSWPESTRVAAIGEATAEALRNSGFQAVISPAERHDSEALLALDALRAVDGWHIVIFRGRGGRELLKEALEARGAHVAYAECYRRVRPSHDAAAILAPWKRGEIHAVSVLSNETLDNFLAMIGPPGRALLGGATLVVPHPAVGRHPAAREFAGVIVAPPGRDSMVRALASLRVTP